MIKKTLLPCLSMLAGMMIGGGAVVTAFAGVVTWVVDHFMRSP